MNATTNRKTKRKLTSLELSKPAQDALSRIMQIQRWNKKTSVEMSLQNFASGLRASK